MKKLLLTLLCLPMIGFGQDIRIDELIKIKSSKDFEEYMYEKNFNMRKNYGDFFNDGSSNFLQIDAYKLSSSSYGFHPKWKMIDKTDSVPIIKYLTMGYIYNGQIVADSIVENNAYNSGLSVDEYINKTADLNYLTYRNEMKSFKDIADLELIYDSLKSNHDTIYNMRATVSRNFEYIDGNKRIYVEYRDIRRLNTFKSQYYLSNPPYNKIEHGIDGHWVNILVSIDEKSPWIMWNSYKNTLPKNSKYSKTYDDLSISYDLIEDEKSKTFENKISNRRSIALTPPHAFEHNTSYILINIYIDTAYEKYQKVLMKSIKK